MRTSRLVVVCCYFVPMFLGTSAFAQEGPVEFDSIDKATEAKYKKMGCAFVVERLGRPPTICFSAFQVEQKLDFSTKFPEVGVPFGLHFTEFSPMTDESMKSLAHLKNLIYLHLSTTKVTAKGLKHLADLKKLRRLELENKKIDDETLRVLRKLGLLHTLAGANINPVDAERRDRRDYWDSAKDVKRFALLLTKVTDAGLAELAVFENLEYLNVKSFGISGLGLKHLAGLKKLRSLEMSSVTDEGIEQVANLENLRLLEIHSISDDEGSKCPLTDKGLLKLAALRKQGSLGKLTTIRLTYCHHITRAGVEALRKALPRCHVDFAPLPSAKCE